MPLLSAFSCETESMQYFFSRCFGIILFALAAGCSENDPKTVAKKSPKADDGPRRPGDDLQETVPKKYNVESTLKETIKAGMDPLDFKLLSK